MIKKLFIGVAVLGIVTVSVPAVREHAVSLYSWASEGASEALPIDYQLRQASEAVDSLDPEIEKVTRNVVEQRIDVEILAEEVARLEGELTRGADALARRNERLKAGGEVLVTAGRRASRAQFASALEADLRGHQRRSKLLGTRQRTLAANRRTLSASEARLATLVEQRDELSTMVESLRADYEENLALQASGETAVVESDRLSEVQARLDELSRRLRIDREMLYVDGAERAAAPVGTEATEVSAAVDAYLVHREQGVEESADSALISGPAPR